jgi:23S rRNA (uracil1939-C5)-methyltransferase
VARVDRGAVLVPGTLPGERVVAAVEPLHGGLGRGRLLELLQASPSRVEPACSEVRRCGGCELMHADLETQRATRRGHLLDALRRAFGGIDLPPPTLHSPGPPLAYRQRARLLAEAGRGGVRLGYRGARSHALVAVRSCPVLRPELETSMAPVAALLEGSRGRGEVLLALGAGALPVAEIHWRGTLAAEAFQRADAGVRSGALAGVRLWAEGATAPAVFGDPRPEVRGADGAPLWIAPGGFAQPSEEGGLALAARVAELTTPGARLVELFAGSGTLTVALGRGRRTGEPYLAVEQAPEAVAVLRENLAARQLAIKVREADANAIAIPPATHTVVLDPPRAGAAGACAAIAAARPREVVYVSCNPATLARDLPVLHAAGLRPSHVELFDLFPQTAHQECVVRLERR